MENNGTWLELHPTPSIGDTDVTSPKDLDQNNRFDAYSDRYSVYTGSMELAHQQHPHSHRQGKRFTGSMDPLTNHRLQVFYQRYSYSSSTVDDNSVSQCNTDEILKRVSSHTPPAPFHRLYQLGGHCNDRRNKKSSSGRSSGRNSRKTGEGGCLDAQLFSEVKEDHVQVHPSCLAFTAGLQLINIEKFENTDSTTVSSSVYRRHSLKDLTFTVLIRGKSNHTGARQGNESTEKTIQYASINTLGERFDEGDTEEERDDERNEKNVDVKAVVRTGWQTGVYSSTHSCRKGKKFKYIYLQ